MKLFFHKISLRWWWSRQEVMPEEGSILITGGAGYIGSHTIVELLNNNFSVVAIDNLVNAYSLVDDKPEALKRVEIITKKTVPFYKIDINDYDSLDKIFQMV